MKILKADYTRYVPRERLVERVRHGTGFVSEKTHGRTEGAFYLSEYKGDGILSVLDTVVPIIGLVAKGVAKGVDFDKELRGGGIESKALAEVLKVEDTKLGGESSRRLLNDGQQKSCCPAEPKGLCDCKFIQNKNR